MRVVITGANGQIGRSLVDLAPADWQVVPAGSAEVDFADLPAVKEFVVDTAPDVLVNCAAFTGVDRAETEPELASIINGDAPVVLAEAARELGFRMVHLSTDFVFDGKKGRPYLPEDKTSPLSQYGRTKLAGEEAVLEVLGEAAAIVLRTSWVYAARRSNFVLTMLRLMAERDELSVVVDQVGSPTWAPTAAEAIVALLEQDMTGIWHVTDAGACTWYDFAVAIQEEALARGLLDDPITINPIRTVDYPTPATRPHYSVLDKTDTWMDLELEPVHWRVNLRAMMDELVQRRKEGLGNDD